MKYSALLFILISWIGIQSVSAEELFDVQAANDHFNRGLTFYFQKNYSEAIAEFETSIQIDPDNPKAYYFIGYAYYKDRDFSKASDAFRTAYELDSTYAPISTQPPLTD